MNLIQRLKISFFNILKKGWKFGTFPKVKQNQLGFRNLHEKCRIVTLHHIVAMTSPSRGKLNLKIAKFF